MIKDFINKNAGIKFTIVLGSGFHIQKKSNTILSSWEMLLKKMDPNFVSLGNYLLDFEQMILSEKSSLQSSDVEKLKLSQVAKCLKKVQENLDLEKLNKYPIEIFNPDIISDIVILNFDEVAEKICKEVLKCKISSIQYVEIDEKLKSDAKIHQTTRFKEVVFPNKGIIRFWHPHGSIAKSSEMILSARSYAMHIANIERLRKHSKSRIKSNTKLNTWYDQLIQQPVLILGASISNSEWDLWSAFVNRERNFSKKDNKTFRKPIYQMRSSEYLISNENDKKTNEQWFESLFDEKYCFNEQWSMLSKIISK
jgi:hypothetical protein